VNYITRLSAEHLADIRRLASRATSGPLLVGCYCETLTAVEYVSDLLSHGSGPCYMLYAPDHPDTRIGPNPMRPEHVAVTLVTGNGPTSEANADYYAEVTPQLVTKLIDEIERLRRI